MLGSSAGAGEQAIRFPSRCISSGPRRLPPQRMMSSQYLGVHAEGFLDVSHGPGKKLRQSGAFLWSSEHLEMSLQAMAEVQIKKWQHVAQRRHRQQDRRRVSARSSTTKEPASEDVESDAKSSSRWQSLCLLLYAIPTVLAVVCALVSQRLFAWGVAAWFFSEVLFLLLHMMAHARADRGVVQNTIPEMSALNLLVDRFTLLRERISIEEFMSGWFLGAPFESIYRDNVREFLCYGFFHSDLAQLTADHRERVEVHLERVESVWNVRFPEGYNPTLKYMASERDPLQVVHRPLMLYMWSECVAFFTGFVLRLLGFQRYKGANNCLVYWLRRSKAEGGEVKDNMPTVFVHGLGIGVTPYLSFIDMLFKKADQDAIVVELPHVAMRLRRVIPNVDQLAEDLRQMHEKHFLKPACYIGHSYGSLVIARFCQLHPEYVRATALIDPVCFLICLPFTIYNFIYRLPDGEVFSDWLGDCLRWYFVSRELQVAQALCRGFNWHNIELWPEQLPPTTLVLLSGRDAIVPASHIRKHLECSGVPVIWYEEFRHAEFLFRPDVQRNLMKMLIKVKEEVEGLHAANIASAPGDHMKTSQGCAATSRQNTTLKVTPLPHEHKGGTSHAYSLRPRKKHERF